jgi:hypothetical protein
MSEILSCHVSQSKNINISQYFERVFGTVILCSADLYLPMQLAESRGIML